jgi:hypothetical protein
MSCLSAIFRTIEKGQTIHIQYLKTKMTKRQPMVHKTLHRKQRLSNNSPLNIEGELRSSGRVSSPCSISDTRRVDRVTNPVLD